MRSVVTEAEDEAGVQGRGKAYLEGDRRYSSPTVIDTLVRDLYAVYLFINDIGQYAWRFEV